MGLRSALPGSPSPGATVLMVWTNNQGPAVLADRNNNDAQLYNPSPSGGPGTFYGVIINGVLVTVGAAPGNDAVIHAACVAKNPNTTVTLANALAFAASLPVCVNDTDMTPVP